MTPINDIPEARRALRRYLMLVEGVLPTATYEQLEAIADSPSPVEQLVYSAELLYARRDQLDDAGRTLVAQFAAFSALNGFIRMAVDRRGNLIVVAMQRDIAAGKVDRDDADPSPMSEYVGSPATADVVSNGGANGAR